MAHRAGIRVQNPTTGEVEETVVELESVEYQALQQYLYHASELEKARICREGLDVKFSVDYKKGRGLFVAVDRPPWDDVIVLLHRLRPFILKEEPHSFFRVKALLGRKLKDLSTVHTLLKYFGDEYTGKNMQALIRMVSNNVLMNSEEMLFTWLNAYEYHRDQEKREFLERLHHILPLEWSQGIFLFLLLDKVKAIRGLSLMIEVILGQRNDFQIAL